MQKSAATTGPFVRDAGQRLQLGFADVEAVELRGGSLRVQYPPPRDDPARPRAEEALAPIIIRTHLLAGRLSHSVVRVAMPVAKRGSGCHPDGPNFGAPPEV